MAFLRKDRSSGSGGNIPWAITKMVLAVYIIVKVGSVAIQEPDKRAPVACYEAYSIGNFFVGVFSIVSLRNATKKLEYSYALNQFRLDCIDYLDQQDWIRAFPYPAFLFGE